MTKNKISKNLSDHLNLLMAEARLSANELAKQTGLPATTIKRMRADEDANPTITSLQPIAQFFSVSISELIGETPLHAPKSLHHRVPLISWENCVHFPKLSEQTESIFTSCNVSKSAFALRLHHDADEHFKKGGILIIDPERAPRSGDYGIVTTKQSDSAFLKKIIMDVDGIYLLSWVDHVTVMKMNKEMKLIGVVLHYSFSFETT